MPGISLWWGLFRASYFQSLNSVFIIALAPVFAWFWIALRKREPSSTAKFSIGLVFVGLGFAILIPVAGGTAVSPVVAHRSRICCTPSANFASARLA